MVRPLSFLPQKTMSIGWSPLLVSFWEFIADCSQDPCGWRCSGAGFGPYHPSYLFPCSSDAFSPTPSSFHRPCPAVSPEAVLLPAQSSFSLSLTVIFGTTTSSPLANRSFANSKLIPQPQLIPESLDWLTTEGRSRTVCRRRSGGRGRPDGRRYEHELSRGRIFPLNAGFYLLELGLQKLFLKKYWYS